MINLELAQKLKSAGLEWEPQWGDFFTYNCNSVVEVTECLQRDRDISKLKYILNAVIVDSFVGGVYHHVPDSPGPPYTGGINLTLPLFHLSAILGV